MDPLTIVMLAVLALLIFFMFRNSRKRQADQRDLQSKVAVGAEVMTNFGLYGTVLAIDEEENKVMLETAPGTVLTLHRQTVTRVVEPAVVNVDDDGLEAIDDGEPEYGERLSDGELDAPESSASESSAGASSAPEIDFGGSRPTEPSSADTASDKKSDD